LQSQTEEMLLLKLETKQSQQQQQLYTQQRC